MVSGLGDKRAATADFTKYAGKTMTELFDSLAFGMLAARPNPQVRLYMVLVKPDI